MMYKGKVSLVMTPELHMKLKVLSTVTKKSYSCLVTELLEEYLRQPLTVQLLKIHIIGE